MSRPHPLVVFLGVITASVFLWGVILFGLVPAIVHALFPVRS